MEAELLFV